MEEEQSARRWWAGHRITYTVQGRLLVILLCGGTKGTQRRDIKRAKAMAAEL